MSETSEYSRDLHKEYELYLLERLNKYNLEEIFDRLIDEEVINGDFIPMVIKAHRYACIKQQNSEAFQLKMILEKQETTGLSFYDYLDGLVAVHYLLKKKSFNRMFM